MNEQRQYRRRAMTRTLGPVKCTEEEAARVDVVLDGTKLSYLIRALPDLVDLVRLVRDGKGGQVAAKKYAETLLAQLYKGGHDEAVDADG